MVDKKELAQILTNHAVGKSKTSYSEKDVTDNMLNFYNSEMKKFMNKYPDFDVYSDDYSGQQDDEFVELLIKTAEKGGYSLVEDVGNANETKENEKLVDEFIAHMESEGSDKSFDNLVDWLEKEYPDVAQGNLDSLEKELNKRNIKEDNNGISTNEDNDMIEKIVHVSEPDGSGEYEVKIIDDFGGGSYEAEIIKIKEKGNGDSLPNYLKNNLKVGNTVVIRPGSKSRKTIFGTIVENVNETIKHEDGKWNVYTKDGSKKLGSHDTEKEAKAQLAAIEINKNENKSFINEDLENVYEYMFVEHPELMASFEKVIEQQLDLSRSTNESMVLKEKNTILGAIKEFIEENKEVKEGMKNVYQKGASSLKESFDKLSINERRTDDKKAKEMADKLMNKVKGYLKDGLPEAYNGDFEEYMYDFYPDLPWDKEGSDVAIQHILDNHKDVLKDVKKKFGFDLEADLNKGLYMEEGKINEKAVSVAQQKTFGHALCVKRGECELSDIEDKDVRDSIKNIVDGMTEKEIEKYAKTSHKDLPKKVEENLTDTNWMRIYKFLKEEQLEQEKPSKVGDEAHEQENSQIDDNTDTPDQDGGKDEMPTQDDPNLGDGQPIKVDGNKVTIKEGDEIETDLIKGSVTKVGEEGIGMCYDDECCDNVECDSEGYGIMAPDMLEEAKFLKINGKTIKEQKEENKPHKDEGSKPKKDPENTETPKADDPNEVDEKDPKLSNKEPLDLEKGDKVKIADVEGTVSKATKSGVEVDTANGETENIAMDGLNINEGCEVNGKPVIVKDGKIYEATDFDDYNDELLKYAEKNNLPSESFTTMGKEFATIVAYSDDEANSIISKAKSEGYDFGVIDVEKGKGNPDKVHIANNLAESVDEGTFDDTILIGWDSKDVNSFKKFEKFKDYLEKNYKVSKDYDIVASGHIRVKKNVDISGYEDLVMESIDEGLVEDIRTALIDKPLEKLLDIYKKYVGEPLDKIRGNAKAMATEIATLIAGKGDKKLALQVMNEIDNPYMIGKHELKDGESYPTKDGEVTFMGYDDAPEAEGKNYLFDNGNGVQSYSKEEAEELLEASEFDKYSALSGWKTGEERFLDYKEISTLFSGKELDKISKTPSGKSAGVQKGKDDNEYDVFVDRENKAYVVTKTKDSSESTSEALKSYRKGEILTGDEAKQFAEEIQRAYDGVPYGDKNHQVSGYFKEKTRSGKEVWTAFDNNTNDLWTEQFKTEDLAKEWAEGKLEVDDLTLRDGVYENFGGRNPRPIQEYRKKSNKLPMFEDFRKNKRKLNESTKLPSFSAFLESKK